MAIKELREATSPKANKEILDVSFLSFITVRDVEILVWVGGTKSKIQALFVD